MRIRKHGIYYIDKEEIEHLSKTEEGKEKLEKMGDYQILKWRIRNGSGQNRESRRRFISPLYEKMKHNYIDRTKKKLFSKNR